MNSWIVVKVKTSFVGKGDIEDEEKIIGYSGKDEKELFEVLEKEFPNLKIRKEAKGRYGLEAYFDKNGKENLPYEDFVYFKKGKLKIF